MLYLDVVIQHRWTIYSYYSFDKFILIEEKYVNFFSEHGRKNFHGVN